jgi:hypothetical protein
MLSVSWAGRTIGLYSETAFPGLEHLNHPKQRDLDAFSGSGPALGAKSFREMLDFVCPWTSQTRLRGEEFSENA